MTAQIADELGRIPMSQRLGVTLRRATDYASAQSHAEVTLEHLLLALTEDIDAEGVLTSSGVPIASLKSDASQHIANIEHRSPAGAADAISISADLRRILEAAAAAARGRRNAINGAIVLAAIVGDGSSAAAHILSAHGMTFEHAIRALQQAPPPDEQATPAQPRSQPQPPQPQQPENRATHDPDSNDAILAEARERVRQRYSHTQAARHSQSAPADAHHEVEVAAPDDPAPAYATPEHSPPVQAPQQTPSPAPLAPQPVVRDRDEPPTAGRRPQHIEPSQPPLQSREQSAPPQYQPPPAPRQDQPGPPPPTDQAGRHAGSWAPPPAPPRGAPQPPRPYRPPPPISPEPSPQLHQRPQQDDQSFGQRPVGAPPHAHAERSPDHRPAHPTGRPQNYGGHPSAPPNRPPANSPGGAPANPPGAPPWADSDALPPLQGPQGTPPQQPRQPAQNRPAHDPRAAAGGQAPTPQRKRAKPGRVQAGQLAENIPRRMRVGITSTAEVRIAKADVKALADGLEGGGAAYKHDLQITKAMSVRLRAPDGGFFIETASPETQWTENVLGMMADDYASWRWNITPKQRGRKRLQLVISARTMGSDGVTAETALPDQVFEVSVKTNYAKTAARTGGWIAAAIVGGLFARFGEQMWDTAQVVARTLSGP